MNHEKDPQKRGRQQRARLSPKKRKNYYCDEKGRLKLTPEAQRRADQAMQHWPTMVRFIASAKESR